MKPSECVLAFGIPTSEEEFWEAKEDPTRDFVSNCCPVWQVYKCDVVAHLEEVTPYLKGLGVKIIYGLKLSDLRRLLTDNSNKVVILFSHWRDDSVEFFDGMASADAVVDEVPADFTGIIDLCVCHPVRLAIKLRDHLPLESLVKFTSSKSTPYKWLYFYWAVFTILDDSDVSYLEALKQSVQAFAELK